MSKDNWIHDDELNALREKAAKWDEFQPQKSVMDYIETFKADARRWRAVKAAIRSRRDMQIRHQGSLTMATWNEDGTCELSVFDANGDDDFNVTSPTLDAAADALAEKMEAHEPQA